jgi:hypothetical protein
LDKCLRRQGRRDSVSWFQVIVLAQRAGARQIRSCPHQLGDLADVPQVVQRPLVQHIDRRYFTSGLVQCHSTPGFIFERAQQFDVRDPLIFK